MAHDPIHLGRNNCATCAIRHRAVCGALADEELKELGAIGRMRQFKAGDIILADEEPTTFFANIVSGVIKLEKTSADGRQQIVGLVFPPDFLGRAFAKSNPYFAQAATDVEACTYPHTAFENMLKKHSGLEHRLFENTLNELDAAREWMFVLGRKSAQEKVASFLHLIAKRQSMVGCSHGHAENEPSGASRFDLPLTRADIADFLGLTIETVSRQLSNLKRQGTIQLLSGREVFVPNVDRLASLASGDDEAVA
ncbi:MAG: Crp/Fnr family transcriptional regulator [Alphaproteobacteria bacterium]|nr:Crp/Fnr family transcriptional regulator [Alphaproteobacteria bacterium]